MRATLQKGSTRPRALLASRRSRPERVEGAGVAPPSDLEARVERLEAELEALQDATYRQDVMHDAKIAELRKNRSRV